MVSKGQKKGTIRFEIKLDGAKKVMLAGDFNQWKPVAMRKQQNGVFTCMVNAPPGTYEYKFIVDGEWIVDPDNPAWALNPYGTLNSVAQVE